MDCLHDIFLKQELLMKRYAKRDSTFPLWPVKNPTKVEQKFIHDTLINAVSEIFEADRELKNSKMHRETEILGFDRESFIEEIVDCTKFLVETLTIIGVTPTEFKQAYDKKDTLCHKRLDEKY